MFTFAIIFDGGFALVATCIEVKAIINEESGVEIQGLSSREAAYAYACKKHVEREFWKNPNAQPVLPRLEDMTNLPVFHSRDFIPQVISQRVFAAMNPTSAGILTSAEAVGEFLGFEPLQTEIREVESIMEAQYFLNYFYLKFILPMAAYITEPIPYCNNIPIDTMIQMPYSEWIRGNCRIIPQIPFEKHPLVKPLKEVVSLIPRSCTDVITPTLQGGF